jgi:hypothetical protein
MPDNTEKTTDSSKEQSARLIKAVLSDPKSLVALFAVYLYFLGFIFAHYYYDHFGLRATINDLPLFTMFVLAYNVLTANPLLSLWGCVLLVASSLYWLLPEKRDAKKWWTAAVDVALAVGILGFLPYAFSCAHKTAERLAADVRRGVWQLPEFQVEFKPDKMPAYTNLSAAASAAPLKLLIENKDYYFLLWQPSVSDIPDIPACTIYTVRKEDLQVGKTIIRRTVSRQ